MTKRDHPKTRRKSWKFQWMRQCRARKERRNNARLRKLKREVVNLTRFPKQNVHVSWKRMSPRDNGWNHVYRKIMKITSQAKEIIQSLLTTWFTSFSHASSDEIFGCKSSSGQVMEEARNDSSMATGQSKEQKGGYSGSTKRQKRSPLCHTDGHRSSQKIRVEPKFQLFKGRIVLRGDDVKDDS